MSDRHDILRRIRKKAGEGQEVILLSPDEFNDLISAIIRMNMTIDDLEDKVRDLGDKVEHLQKLNIQTENKPASFKTVEKESKKYRTHDVEPRYTSFI